MAIVYRDSSGQYLTLDGDSKVLAVAGDEYQLAASCKPHDCADNNILFLYSSVKRVVYGDVCQGSSNTLISMPPPA